MSTEFYLFVSFIKQNVNQLGQIDLARLEKKTGKLKQACQLDQCTIGLRRLFHNAVDTNEILYKIKKIILSAYDSIFSSCSNCNSDTTHH